MVKGIIFDLDGVLVSTDKYHYQAWKKIADKLQVEFNETINDRLREVSRMESLEIILEKAVGSQLSAEQKEMLAEEKNGYYKKLLDNLTEKDALDNAREVLGRLKEDGFLLAVGSSSKNTKKILDKIKLEEMFDIVVDGTDISKSKPDPEVFLKAAERLKLKPEECAVVEDAQAGIDAAIRAGMHAIGYGSIGSYEKCDDRIDKLSEIEKLEIIREAFLSLTV